MDDEVIIAVLAWLGGLAIVALMVFLATTPEKPSPNEQACYDNGGTYVKVFDKDAYYCKGAR